MTHDEAVKLARDVIDGCRSVVQERDDACHLADAVLSLSAEVEELDRALTTRLDEFIDGYRERLRLAERVAEGVSALVRSGYDGPFMGHAVEEVLSTVNEYEKSKAKERVTEMDEDELKGFRKWKTERDEMCHRREAYWLSPEGRAELRDTFDVYSDGSAVRPLLDEVERLEKRLEKCEQQSFYDAARVDALQKIVDHLRLAERLADAFVEWDGHGGRDGRLVELTLRLDSLAREYLASKKEERT